MLPKRVEENWYAGRKIFTTFKIIEGYVSIPYLQKNEYEKEHSKRKMGKGYKLAFHRTGNISA